MLRVDFIFSALHKFGYRDKFIHMFYVAHTNIESKFKINGLLSELLTPMCIHQERLLSMLLYNIPAEVLVNLINAIKRIKGIQIGDHDIKIVNFADNTAIFFRGITCLLNRMQVILKPYENTKIK